jgi:uncharacterized repeat protein (TIGR03847 family)
MSRHLFHFDEPDRFLSGTVGSPGERAFFLQARQGSAIVTLAVEKVQVAALAARIIELADALAPPADDDGTVRRAALEVPIVEAFRVGAIALAWDAGHERMVIEAQPVSEDGGYREIPDDDPEGPDLFRIRLGLDDARGFARHAIDLVQAGRPSCPFCGQPIDERGHLCPRSNPNLN